MVGVGHGAKGGKVKQYTVQCQRSVNQNRTKCTGIFNRLCPKA